MSLPLPAYEIAVGDFIDGYGTVTQVIENRDTRTNVLLTVGFKFFNGTDALGLNPNTVLYAVQGGPGGLKEEMPDPDKIRPGLKADHPDGQ